MTATVRHMGAPLDDIIVIDLTRALAGPHCGMMLGDMGARVIKVETPGGGDESRGWGPPFVGPQEDPISTYFLSCNRNKESVTLDLKSADGSAMLARLVARADVLRGRFDFHCSMTNDSCRERGMVGALIVVAR